MTGFEKRCYDIAIKIMQLATSNERAAYAKKVKDNLLRTHTAKFAQRVLSGIRKQLRQIGTLPTSLERVLKLSKSQIKRLNERYEERLKMKLERHEHTQIENEHEYIQNALDWTQSNSYIKIGLGLMVLTGRRTVEIFKTGVFEKAGKTGVKFNGQAKKRGLGVGYKIYTLCDSQHVLDALQRLRGLKDFEGKTESEVSSTTAPQLNKMCLFMQRWLGKGCTPHDTRKAYISLVTRKHKPAKMSFRTFAAKMLGHEPNGLQTETYLKYVQF